MFFRALMVQCFSWIWTHKINSKNRHDCAFHFPLRTRFPSFSPDAHPQQSQTRVGGRQYLTRWTFFNWTDLYSSTKRYAHFLRIQIIFLLSIFQIRMQEYHRPFYYQVCPFCAKRKQVSEKENRKLLTWIMSRLETEHLFCDTRMSGEILFAHIWSWSSDYCSTGQF